MAQKLDPQNYLWPWGIYFSITRLQRFDDRTRAVNFDSEEDNLRKAIELSNEQKVLPIISLADMFLTTSKDFLKAFEAGHKGPKAMVDEARQLFEKAYNLSPESPDVLMRYAKLFINNGEHEEAKAMLKKSSELNPYNGQTWFRLGQVYHLQKVPDLAKAEEYYKKAVTSSHERFFFAEIDLGWVRKQNDRTYDLVKHFQAMRIHYPNDTNRQLILSKKIKQARRN